VPIDVARALSLVRDDILYPTGPGCAITDPGTKDTIWLPVAGAKQWVVIMRDKHIRSRPGERYQLTAHGVRAFVMTGGGNYTKWQTIDLLVRRWAEIESIADRELPPFIYSITQAGVSRLAP
jgi:hypothetical protein